MTDIIMHVHVSRLVMRKQARDMGANQADGTSTRTSLGFSFLRSYLAFRIFPSAWPVTNDVCLNVPPRTGAFASALSVYLRKASVNLLALYADWPKLSRPSAFSASRLNLPAC